MLLDRAETDWLGSKTVFYNTRTRKISYNINDLIDVNHIDFHPEGLCNYLDFGYSVFGQTPIREIRILEPFSVIETDCSNNLVITHNTDRFENDLGNSSSENDVIEYISTLVDTFCEKSESIVIPTSGGFDSRLIISLCKDYHKINSYTYGANEKDDLESRDVVYARELCSILGIPWKKITLGNYHNYMQDWYDLYGVSTHAHGMYQMEFYKIIRGLQFGKVGIISGILGDVWAGNWTFDDILCSKDIMKLGRTYGLNSSSDICKLKHMNNNELRDDFFDRNKYKLKDANWRIIIAARMKIVLLSYLLRVPDSEGFETWSPYLDYDVAAGMINLEWNRKERRKWQVEYFRKKGLLIGDLKLEYEQRAINNIFNMALRMVPLEKLDAFLLGQVIDEDYVEAINRHINNLEEDGYKWYHAYLVLWPLQRLLTMRDSYL